MKWPLLVLIGAVLVTAWARTVPSSPGGDARAADELVRALNANASAMLQADAAFRQFARADSLLPLLPASPGLTVSLSPALPAAARDTVTTAAVSEMVQIAEPRARVGVFLVDEEYGRHPGMPYRPRGSGRELYVGSDSAGAYCAVVAGGIVHDGSMETMGFRYVRDSRVQRSSRRVLGPCAFIARYGAPGREVSQWLSGGAYRLAELEAPAGPRGDHGGLVLWTGGDVRMRGCIGGRQDLCARVALEAGRTARAAPQGAATFDLGPALLLADRTNRTMLSDMEAGFGTDRFARFWSSDRDVEAAFAGAFGMNLGAWVRDWGEARFGREKLGPGVDALTLLLSAFMVVALAGIAALISARRTI